MCLFGLIIYVMLCYLHNIFYMFFCFYKLKT